MPNSRRIARELALKALFQVDVGKQPLSEVLDGALDQLRVTVTHPVSQLYDDASAAIRRIVAGQERKSSTQSKRQVSIAARSVLNELRALVADVGEITRSVVAERPSLELEGAGPALRSAIGRTIEGIRRASTRPSLQEELLRAIGQVGEARARSVEPPFERHIRPAARTAQFVVRLALGTAAKQHEIDARIASLSSEWALDRQPAVDRNILRLAAYEVLYEPEIPTGASINEAVELAKKYSTAESGRFVNGVLGALAGQAPAKHTAAEPEEHIEMVAETPGEDEGESVEAGAVAES